MKIMKPYYLKKAEFSGWSSHTQVKTKYCNKKDFEKVFKGTGKIFRFNKGEYVFVVTLSGILLYKRGEFDYGEVREL